MRFRFVEGHRTAWPAPVMRGVPRVSPSGCYAWRARPESKRAAEGRALLDDVRQAPAGSPRVQAALRGKEGKRDVAAWSA